jgi:biotin carboxylase
MFFRRRRLPLTRLFISVGAGFNQIPLIDEAKRAGFSVIGIDRNPSAAGLLKCDIRIQESIYNHQDIYQKVQELLIDGVVKGALTRSYGEAVRSVAQLNEKIGCPFIPLSSIDSLIDKRKMKQVLAKHKIATPQTYTVTSVQQIKQYPCIIKPVKGHSKEGVRYCASAKDAKQYFSEHTDAIDTYIVQKYIAGDECIAAGMTIDGVFRLIELSDKKITDLPCFVDIQHTSPSVHTDRWVEVETIGQLISDAFKIRTSPLLFEFRIDSSGNLVIIEVIPEFGGEFIADHLIPARSGYNFIGQAIRAITGQDTEKNPKLKHRRSVVVRYITARKEGTLSSFTPLPKKKINNVRYSAIFKDIGAQVKPPQTNHDRLGVIITTGRSLNDALALADEVENMYAIKIREKRKK